MDFPIKLNGVYTIGQDRFDVTALGQFSSPFDAQCCRCVVACACVSLDSARNQTENLLIFIHENSPSSLVGQILQIFKRLIII